MIKTEYQYVLYVDEAGDDKVKNLKPQSPQGNSEWLCLGGYLVRSQDEAKLEDRRDAIYRSFGGMVGSPLHFRNCKPWNRIKICKQLGKQPARAFVVCSFKRTMVGHSNKRAEASGNDSSNRQYLYNFVARLLLERVSEFVEVDAQLKDIPKPKVKIVMASRKGHHFGHFKAYVLQLIRQATAKSTFLKAKEINPNIFQYNLIDRFPASEVAGLQLADAVVSATFQSIEQSSPHFRDTPARYLKPIFAGTPRWSNGPIFMNNLGMTVFPPNGSPTFLNDEQKLFFSNFGYDFEWMEKNQK